MYMYMCLHFTFYFLHVAFYITLTFLHITSYILHVSFYILHITSYIFVCGHDYTPGAGRGERPPFGEYGARAALRRRRTLAVLRKKHKLIITIINTAI